MSGQQSLQRRPSRPTTTPEPGRESPPTICCDIPLESCVVRRPSAHSPRRSGDLTALGSRRPSSLVSGSGYSWVSMPRRNLSLTSPGQYLRVPCVRNNSLPAARRYSAGILRAVVTDKRTPPMSPMFVKRTPPQSPRLPQRECRLPPPPLSSPQLFDVLVDSTVSSTRHSRDIRRWSLTSIADSRSSGYGTNTPGGCNSNSSSVYSSQERLSAFPMPPEEEGDDGEPHPHRHRSRSLSSPCRSPYPEEDSRLLNNVMFEDRFPKEKEKMEAKLRSLIEEADKLSQEFSPSICGAFSFIHKQMLTNVELVLSTSVNNSLTFQFFVDISLQLTLLQKDAREKCPPTLSSRLSELVTKLLLIIAQPARLLECLEFKPIECYQLMEACEDQLRTDAESGEIKKSVNIGRYVVEKLGLLLEPNPISSLIESEGDDEVTSPSPVVKDPSMDDFEHVNLISNGAFGQVNLVKYKPTKQLYAMKMISKQNMVLRNMPIEQVFAERDIMNFAENPFVVSLFCSLETSRHLCFVMEFVKGGDLAALLKNIGGPLPYDQVLQYFMEIVIALEYLHCYGIVHRDIKPENMLVTELGHIKLGDFGLSKIGLMNLTTTLYDSCFKDLQVLGTPHYIAPEVILRDSYSYCVDWWSSGICLYEFIVGCTPFLGQSAEEVFDNIVNQYEVEFPDDTPEVARCLILGLLQKQPEYRLGKMGADELKSHPFFEGCAWDDVLSSKVQFFIPSLDAEDDTSYFDSRKDRFSHDDLSAALGDDEADEDDALNQPMAQSFPSARFNSVSPMFMRESLPSPDPSPAEAPAARIPSISVGSEEPVAESPTDSGVFVRSEQFERPLTVTIPVSPRPSSSSGNLALTPPVTINKGHQGYGFVLDGVRVYNSLASEHYQLHHKVVSVLPNGPAFEAHLQPNDIITHVNDKAVADLTHQEVVALIIHSPGGKLRLKTIRIDAPGSWVRSTRRHHGHHGRRGRDEVRLYSVVQRHRHGSVRSTPKRSSPSMLRHLSSSSVSLNSEHSSPGSPQQLDDSPPARNIPPHLLPWTSRRRQHAPSPLARTPSPATTPSSPVRANPPPVSSRTSVGELQQSHHHTLQQSLSAGAQQPKQSAATSHVTDDSTSSRTEQTEHKQPRDVSRKLLR